MTKEQISEMAEQLIEHTNKIAHESGLHSVLIIWISELGTIERNVGYFEDYMEASLFMSTYEQYYISKNKTFSIYVNGQFTKSNLSK